MRQIWVPKYGPPDVLTIQNVASPIPRNGEVRIRVESIGVNFADIMARMGAGLQSPNPPFVPGIEISGTIDAVGSGVPDFQVGDDVFGFTEFGGYAEQVCVPYKQVFRRLQWMSADDAAALPTSYLLAYLALMVYGSIQPSQKVLIHNAAGGLGLAAIDLCRIKGAEVYATASPEKHDFLLERGVRHVIDYRNQDYERIVNDLTGGKGVHVILDSLGGIHWPKNYRLLLPTGRLIHFGFSGMVSGKRRRLLDWWRGLVMIPFYTPLQLMRQNKGVAGIDLLSLFTADYLLTPWMNQLVAWYDEALFRPYIDRTFPFDQMIAAHHYLQDRKNLGKVIVHV